MKIIVDGGATTKNVGANTRDAIILGLNTNYVDGFKIKVYLTLDNELVTLSDDIYDLFTQKIARIQDKTLQEILAYNIGNKVKKQQVLSLKEVLTIFGNYNKELILELVNHQNKNALYTDMVLVTIQSYSNINIKLETANSEIFSYLRSSTNAYQLGLIVNEDNLNNWYQEADFYDIFLPLISIFDIRDKTNEGKIVMLDQVNNREVFDQIYNEYRNIWKYIYIITSQLSNIN